MKKLKPIVFIKGSTSTHMPDIFRQNMLLKALPHTTDLEELRKVAQFHTKTQVLKTLDKLAIRKEFHEALERNGLDIQNIVAGIQNICVSAEKDDTRLKGYQTILKAVGLDKYETDDSGGKNWEELLVKLNEVENKKLEPAVKATEVKYEVIQPTIPDDVKKRLEKDREIGKSIYE